MHIAGAVIGPTGERSILSCSCAQPHTSAAGKTRRGKKSKNRTTVSCGDFNLHAAL